MVGVGEPLAAARKLAFAPYVMDWLPGLVVTVGATLEDAIASEPFPVAESPDTTVFCASTVNDVAPDGEAAVVEIVKTDVFDVSDAEKLTVLGLNEVVTPAGNEVVTLNAALKDAPVDPFRLTVTAYVALPAVPDVNVPV
jgi:hypothetical protein